MSSTDPDEVVRLITASNYVQAHVWEQALRAAGIECRVVGDYLTASVGGVPGVPAEIWVHRNDLERARGLLEEAKAAPEEDGPGEESAEGPQGEGEPPA